MNSNRSRRLFLGIPDEFWVGFVIMVGFFLKLVYDIELGYTAGTSNPGIWKELEGGIPSGGHIGVIQYYFTYHHLPSFDVRQASCFSNPPFYYIVSSLLLEIFHRLLSWDIGTSLHLVQCINVIYVMVGEGACIGILSKFGVRGRKMAISILFITFFPVYYLLGAALEPSAMVFMFMMLALNSALSWYHSRRAGMLRATAILMGLGFMTSFSMLIVVPPIALLMFQASHDGRRNSVPFRQQFRNFAIIVCALALWWPLYRLIRFGVPITYMEADYGERIREPFLARLALPTPAYFSHLHTLTGGRLESNIWAQTWKTAIVGFNALDLTLRGTYVVALFMVYLSAALCLLLHIMLLFLLITRRIDTPKRRFILTGYLSMLGFYLVAAFMIPYTGTMDFKDIAPILIFPMIGFGLCGGYENSDSAFERVTSNISTVMILALCLIAAFLFGFYM